MPIWNLNGTIAYGGSLPVAYILNGAIYASGGGNGGDAGVDGGTGGPGLAIFYV